MSGCSAPASTIGWAPTRSGRDVFTRALWGARTSLPVAAIVIAASVVVGTVIGAAAGFFGGWIDAVLMRLVDITMAFPPILLAMAITASLGPGIRNALIAMVLVWWPIYARLLRAQVIAVRQREYVESAEAIGAPRWLVLRRYILPMSYTPVLVNATMDFGQVVLLTASLSFIGLGARPPSPEWGAMITEGATNFYQWWIAAAPGVAILIVVLGVQLPRRRAARPIRREGLGPMTDLATPDRAAPPPPPSRRRYRADPPGARPACHVRTADGRAPPCAGSTSTSGRAKRSPSSASRARARASRCWRCSGCCVRPRSPARRATAAPSWSGSTQRACAPIRGNKVSMIFQDPMTSLNPVLTIGRQMTMVMRAHQTRPRQARGTRPGRRAARPGRDLAGRPAVRQLPARAVGRHAPAGHDRDGDRQPTRRC